MTQTPPPERAADGAAAMRIILLLRSLSLGGAERQATLLARELAGRGHSVTIATFYGGGALEADLAGSNVTVQALNKTGRGDVFGFARRLGDFLEQSKPDILYSYLTVPNLLSALARKRNGAPRVIWGVRASDMEMGNYDWLSRLTFAIEPALAPRADAVVANAGSAADFAIARGFPRRKMRVIANGVDQARFRFDAAARDDVRMAWGVPDQALVVGHVARLDPMKDHPSFIAAFAEASRKDDLLRGVLVTSGEEARAALSRMIATARLSERMQVFASIDSARAMSGFDLFCSSSAYGEGFSNVLCEALAAGLTCVATRVGDAEAILGDIGFLALPRDPESIAAGLLLAAQARRGGEARSKAASEARAALFSPAIMAGETEQLMRTLLARR